MTPAMACCADCCPASLSAPPTFTVRTGSAWSDAIAFGLVVIAVVLTGFFVLVQVARALAVLRPL